MGKMLRMHLFFTLLVTLLCVFLSACTTAEQPIETNQSESISTSAKSDLFIEYEKDSLVSFQSEPVNHAQHTELEIWEQSISIRDNLLDYKLRLSGDQDVFTELSIINPSTGAVVYEGYFDSDNGISKELFTVEIIDMDFGGYRDIDVFTGFGGTWKQYHMYIMWNPETASFVGDTYGLTELGLPNFDAENKLVYSMDRASAADHWYFRHKYVEGKLVTIDEIADNCVWGLYNDEFAKAKIKASEPLYDEDHTSFHQYVRKILNTKTMEMTVVESKFILYNVSNASIIAEYDSDSAIGLFLVQYETRSDIN